MKVYIHDDVVVDFYDKIAKTGLTKIAVCNLLHYHISVLLDLPKNVDPPYDDVDRELENTDTLDDSVMDHFRVVVKTVILKIKPYLNKKGIETISFNDRLDSLLTVTLA
jgi:hypothetical protein